MRAQKTNTGIRQEQIAQAALDVIGAEGFYALSIAGIAERVGIMPSTVYRHYKSKDDVLEAVLNLLQDRLMGNVAAVRKETPVALQRLKSLMFRHARMLSENRAIPRVIFSDGIYAGRPERKAKVRNIMTRYLGEIQKIVQEGQQEGTIRTEIVPETASLLFLGVILPAAILWNITEGGFDVMGHVENAWPAFERGIAAKP